MGEKVLTDYDITTIDEAQKRVFEEYKKNKYLNSWSTFEKTYTELQAKLDIAELGLITTEISEAMEKVRNKNNNNRDEQLTKIGFECADIIIRTLNFMSRNGLRASYFILDKNDINLKRGDLHGRKV